MSYRSDSSLSATARMPATYHLSHLRTLEAEAVHVMRETVAEFVERSSPGGLRISINDGGARPDTVFLRLVQGSALMEAK